MDRNGQYTIGRNTTKNYTILLGFPNKGLGRFSMALLLNRFKSKSAFL